MKNTKEYLDKAISKTIQPEIETIEQKLLKLVEADRTVSALGNVINFIITDAFNLTSEETIWVSRLLSQALEPLRKVIPTATMGAVTQEMLNGTYSLRMFERTNNPSPTQTPQTITPNTKYATATEWTEGICQIIFASYPQLRPTITSRIIGSIHGIFTELEVTDDPKTTRLSTYLPNNIRYLLNQN